MCFPRTRCYIVEGGQSLITVTRSPRAAAAPWYAKLWRSVQQADGDPKAPKSPAK